MMDISHSNNDKLWQQWEDLEASKPPNPKRKPTADELRRLQAYKSAKQNFFKQIPPEQASWFHAKRRAPPKVSEKLPKPQSPKPSGVILSPKPTPVCLGWTPNDSFLFRHVIPFLSHRRRTRHEEGKDEAMSSGIDRRVFSNLFVDSNPLRIDVGPSDAALMGHAATYAQALCAESYYMAAKARDAWDARFIMEELNTNSYEVACFGHNSLLLTPAQKDRLEKLGAPREDFARVESAEGTRWLRGKDGVVPVREGWHETRHNVFMYILRRKFDTEAPMESAARRTMEALVKMIKESGELPYLVEHRKADRFWGDGLDGEGFNVLGRVLTQIVLEQSGISQKAPMKPWSELTGTVGRPNSTLVMYTQRTDDS